MHCKWTRGVKTCEYWDFTLPGTGEEPAAPVFVDGNKFKILRGKNIADDFKKILYNYIDENYEKNI